MPIFISRGRYMAGSIKGLIANPRDRNEMVAELAAAAGTKLISYDVTLGKHDFMTIVEAPGAREASAFVLAAASGGGVTDVETIEAMTGAEAKAAFATAAKAASSYRLPGRD